MEQINHTKVAFFIIKGISEDPDLQVPIFLLVLLLYLVTLGGNMAIFFLVCLDQHLHTPMYFFLANLSVLDTSSATVVLHETLHIFVTGDRTVPYVTCIAQMVFFGAFLNAELLILMAMSYDRYVAVCNPLRYVTIMNHTICITLAIGCWTLSFLEVMPYIVLLVEFTCYKSNVINHFFCDIMPVIKLSCNDTSRLETLFFIEGIFIQFLIPFLLTFASYGFIVVTILRIRSRTGRRKAFYTCSSHLAVVLLLYATLFLQYQTPVTEDSLDYNKFFSLFNTVAVPFLNPLIYSLKNKDVKSAVRRRMLAFSGYSPKTFSWTPR